MSWLIIWAYIIGSLVYHGQLSNVIWIALMTFDGAGIIRLTHEDGREVVLIERLITLREVLMSWTIYVTLKYTTIIPDMIFGWLPLYSAVRWTFFSLFITTRTTSARPIFITFIKPLFSRYETQIDLLLELITATTALITHYTHYYPLEAYGDFCLGVQLAYREIKADDKPGIYILALPFVRWVARRRSARQLAAKARAAAAARLATTKACTRIIDAQKQAFEAHRVAMRRERPPRSLTEHIQFVREEYDNLVDGPIVGPHPVDVFRVFDLGKTPLEEAIGYIELAKTLPLPPKLRFDSAPTYVNDGPGNADLSRLPHSPTPAKYDYDSPSFINEPARERLPGAPSPDERNLVRYGTFPGAWPQHEAYIAHSNITRDAHAGVTEDKVELNRVDGSPGASRGVKRSAVETPEGHREKYARTRESCPGAPRKQDRTIRPWASDTALPVRERKVRARSRDAVRSDGDDEVFGIGGGSNEAFPRSKRARHAQLARVDASVTGEQDERAQGRGRSDRVGHPSDARRERDRRVETSPHKHSDRVGVLNDSERTRRRRASISSAAATRGSIEDGREDTEREERYHRRRERSTILVRGDRTVSEEQVKMRPASVSSTNATRGSTKSSAAGTARHVVPTGSATARQSSRQTIPNVVSAEIKLVPIRRAPMPYDINARPGRLGSFKGKGEEEKPTPGDTRKRVPLEQKYSGVPRGMGVGGAVGGDVAYAQRRALPGARPLGHPARTSAYGVP